MEAYWPWSKKLDTNLFCLCSVFSFSVKNGNMFGWVLMKLDSGYLIFTYFMIHKDVELALEVAKHA